MNRDRDKAHFNDDLKSKIISIGFVVGCGFLVNSCCVLLCPQPAQAQVTYQKIQQMGKKVCSFMGGRSKLDGQTLMIMTHILEQDLADSNPISLALNQYVLQNCPKDYLAYQRRKIRTNPFAKNPLIVKTGVSLLSGNSTPLLSGNSAPLLSGNSTPEIAENYRMKGRKLLATRNYSDAVGAYDRAIALDSSTASDYYYRGWSLYQVKQLEPALKDLDRAIELNPNQADFYLIRGLVIAATGDRQTALANYSQAILLQRGSANELNPQLVRAYHQRSLLRRDLGDIEGANLDRAMIIKLGIK